MPKQAKTLSALASLPCVEMVPHQGYNILQDVFLSDARMKVRWDLVRLYGLVLLHKPSMILELGVQMGGSTHALLTAASVVGASPVISMDIRDYTGAVLSIHPEYHNWLFYKGDSRIGLPREVERTVRARCDFIFLDTSHLYKDTLQELEYWMPILQPGGLMVMHDLSKKGHEVSKALVTWLNVQEDRDEYRVRVYTEGPSGFGTVEKPGNGTL